MGWSAVVNSILGLLKKFGGPLFAFLMGRSSKQRELEKAEKKALEKELDNEREEDDILSDPDELARMRKRHHREE